MQEKFNKIWKDPVGSNVIAFIIITLLTSLVGAIFELAKGLYNNIPLADIISGIAETLILKTQIPVWLLITLIGICLTAVYQLVKKVLKGIKKAAEPIKNEDHKGELQIFHYGNGQHFFANRMGYAFPGLRNKLEWYKGREAVDRLSRLLSEPLVFKSPDSDGIFKPMWWYRAGSSMFIESFKKLSRTKCLMDNHELIADKIAVYHSQAEFQNFVYVEVQPDKPSGVYSYPKGYIERRKKEMGHYLEEFGLYEGIAIKMEEYSDGAANIKGKIVDTHGAKTRTRNLTKYNFLITSMDSPYNSKRFDRDSGEILNGILNGKKSFQNLFDFLMTFDRFEKFDNGGGART